MQQPKFKNNVSIWDTPRCWETHQTVGVTRVFCGFNCGFFLLCDSCFCLFFLLALVVFVVCSRRHSKIYIIACRAGKCVNIVTENVIAFKIIQFNDISSACGGRLRHTMNRFRLVLNCCFFYFSICVCFKQRFVWYALWRLVCAKSAFEICIVFFN